MSVANGGAAPAVLRDAGRPPRAGVPLGLAGLAALLASGCCVAPLLLALVGISGAWISQMRRLEPYSAALIALSIGALALAGWRLYRRPVTNDAGCTIDDAACGVVNRAARRWFWLVAVLTAIPVLVPLLAPWFY